MSMEVFVYKVYKHTFPNNKVYIGITKLNKPEYRWKDGKGYKNQPLMYDAIQKYGWDNIEHKILYYGLTKEEAEQIESELIKEYKSNNIEFGYNSESGGSFNKTISEEAKQKLSESRTRKVTCVETNITYNSAKEASEITGINKYGICCACNGRQKTSGGYHWTY